MVAETGSDQQLRDVLEIASALSSEADLPRLLDLILAKARALTSADAGLSAEVFDQIAFVQSVFFKQPQLDLCFWKIFLPLLQDPGVIAD